MKRAGLRIFWAFGFQIKIRKYIIQHNGLKWIIVKRCPRGRRYSRLEREIDLGFNGTILNPKLKLEFWFDSYLLAIVVIFRVWIYGHPLDSSPLLWLLSPSFVFCQLQRKNRNLPWMQTPISVCLMVSLRKGITIISPHTKLITKLLEIILKSVLALILLIYIYIYI